MNDALFPELVEVRSEEVRAIHKLPTSPREEQQVNDVDHPQRI